MDFIHWRIVRGYEITPFRRQFWGKLAKGMNKMTENLTELHRAKRGAAALTACVVQTLNESDPTFQERFLKRLGGVYSEFRDNTDGDVTQELELFQWTRQYLTGWNPITGQGKPLGGE